MNWMMNFSIRVLAGQAICEYMLMLLSTTPTSVSKYKKFRQLKLI
jgi:hypothetical protein